MKVLLRIASLAAVLLVGVQALAAAPKRVLVVVTSDDKHSDGKPTGAFLGEITNFAVTMKAKGYEIDIASPKGGAAPIDPASHGVFAFLDRSTNAAFENDADLAGKLAHTLAPADVKPGDYSAIYFAGGHGAVYDLPSSPFGAIAAKIYEQGGVVSAVCHGTAALLGVKLPDGTPLVAGKKVTGYSDFEERLSFIMYGFDTYSRVPLHTQDALAAEGGKYEKALIPFTSHVVTDGRLVTGQNPESPRGVALAVASILARQGGTGAREGIVPALGALEK